MTDFAVQVKSLVKVYNGRVKALDGVDLIVEAGETFALLGPNGAGKTTLMRVLTTQLKPSAGDAYVFGLNVVHDSGKVRKLVSYVPQEMSVWTDINGYENLLIYAKIFGIPRLEREKIIDDALNIMGLTGVKKDLVRTYSGGMIRRLEIACAMLVKPKIMFLDEPTIGLDPGARKIVWEKLNIFKKEYGVTIFFNTHYMDEADLYADDISIIDRGKIVARGTGEELKRSVGGEIVSFTLKNPQSESWLLEEVRRLKFVKDAFMEDRNLNVLVDDAESSLPYITDFLKSKALNADRISITKPTLDDVFLKYTGGRLEERGRISDVRQVRYMIRR